MRQEPVAVGAVVSAAEELQALVRANAEAERRLLLQHERIVAASESSNADDEHDPEGSTVAWERQQVAALLEQVRRTGDALRRASADVVGGRWGTCETCGRPVGEERLAVRPQARSCIDCARAAERRRP